MINNLSYLLNSSNRPNSFPLILHTVRRWKDDLDNKIRLPDGSPLPCVLVGNKVSCHSMHLICFWAIIWWIQDLAPKFFKPNNFIAMRTSLWGSFELSIDEMQILTEFELKLISTYSPRPKCHRKPTENATTQTTVELKPPPSLVWPRTRCTDNEQRPGRPGAEQGLHHLLPDVDQVERERKRGGEPAGRRHRSTQAGRATERRGEAGRGFDSDRAGSADEAEAVQVFHLLMFAPSWTFPTCSTGGRRVAPF